MDYIRQLDLPTIAGVFVLLVCLVVWVKSMLDEDRDESEVARVVGLLVLVLLLIRHGWL